MQDITRQNADHVVEPTAGWFFPLARLTHFCLQDIIALKHLDITKGRGPNCPRSSRQLSCNQLQIMLPFATSPPPKTGCCRYVISWVWSSPSRTFCSWSGRWKFGNRGILAEDSTVLAKSLSVSVSAFVLVLVFGWSCFGFGRCMSLLWSS